MLDFRLKVFHTVAKRLNFTRAARELYISQPAVTKHVKALEQEYGIQLFERNGTKIQLTYAGELLLQSTEKIFEIYRKLETDLHALSGEQVGKLRIGASTTIANYILPKVLPAFREKYSDVDIELLVGNTEWIEKLLENKDIDLGVTEGVSKSPGLKYTPFIRDEIVLTGSADHPAALKGTIDTEELKQQPLLIREFGSGTLDVITHALQALHIKISDLHIALQLTSSEGIKLYLQHSGCLAFLSVYTIQSELQNNSCSIIDVEGLEIERLFYFVRLQGHADILTGLFMDFALRYNYR
ncbi:LysR family transcriptional regulator [Sinomicrobium weinanense]|uniref:LysR family transcriptional regulator n=1 Tax=Sinomicrobium weinanense TaxID=2842200 RepID=A0A926Q5F9_9FLAO|nr:LysR family transcriptional regulator [Sinomicrobium weinanense]MBC9798116.1 LysR family transcriptional regulator [Sinomicrobium weinanense]MBU3122990.1 LysR family transcriptional regulator [Sinomicrobium weinanense]